MRRIEKVLREVDMIESDQEEFFHVPALSLRTILDECIEANVFMPKREDGYYLAEQTEGSNVIYRMSSIAIRRDKALVGMLDEIIDNFPHKPLFIYSSVEDATLNTIIAEEGFERMKGEFKDGSYCLGNIDVFIWKGKDNEDGYHGLELVTKSHAALAERQRDSDYLRHR